MFGRPRCREWTPLASQQLRLRSLIQIVGYNIRPPEECSSHCSFYLTLHHKIMSAPFYTSERITSPHPKWMEIDSEITQRMASSNIVVRIWCHSGSTPNKNNLQDKSQDLVIQTWGVYFSGLRYLGTNLARNFTSDCFKANTLVFQMQGGYFCSYKSLKLDVIQPENEIEHGSLSSDSSNKTSSNKVTIESKFLQTQKLKESRSISPSKSSKKNDLEYSKSHSPIERGFKQSFPSIRTSTSLNINKAKGDTNQIYEHSPSNPEFDKGLTDNLNTSQDDISASKIDLSETAENYDLRSDSDWLPKYRYLAVNFLKSEIRPSYNVTKLQKLHLLQYSIKKRQEAVNECKERIYKKSALSYEQDSSDQYEIKAKFKSKPRNMFDLQNEVFVEKASVNEEVSNVKVKSERPVANGPRLTLKLNDLLSLKSKPSPMQRAEHIFLTKQLEILRFKRILLADERDRKLASIRRLKEIYSKLFEENQDVGLELMQGYHALCRRHATLAASQESSLALRELCSRTHVELQLARTILLRQIELVFPIIQSNNNWTICGIPLAISEDTPSTTPRNSEPIAADFVARSLVLASRVLDKPLRYGVTFTPLYPVIADIARNIPDTNIPLFPKGGDATLFRYGMFLLNKCIVQLLYHCSQPVSDLRPTLPNMKTLLSHSYNKSDTARLFGTYKGPDRENSRTQSLRSLVASDRGRPCRQFNRFKDAVDGQNPQTVLTLRRLSKSVGSCPLDHDPTTSAIGSDPNISTAHENNMEASKSLKSHSSDSDLIKIRDNLTTNVVFTLGDKDDPPNVTTQRLVKLSVHNDFEITNQANIEFGFQSICNEIESYCTKNTGLDDACAAKNCDCVIESGSAASEFASNVNDKIAVDETSIDIVKYLDHNDQDVNITEIGIEVTDFDVDNQKCTDVLSANCKHDFDKKCPKNIMNLGDGENTPCM